MISVILKYIIVGWLMLMAVDAHCQLCVDDVVGYYERLEDYAVNVDFEYFESVNQVVPAHRVATRITKSGDYLSVSCSDFDALLDDGLYIYIDHPAKTISIIEADIESDLLHQHQMEAMVYVRDLANSEYAQVTLDSLSPKSFAFHIVVPSVHNSQYKIFFDPTTYQITSVYSEFRDPDFRSYGMQYPKVRTLYSSYNLNNPEKSLRADDCLIELKKGGYALKPKYENYQLLIE